MRIAKKIENRWSNLLDEKNFTLVKFRVGDVLFTPFKKEAHRYNKKFPNNLTWSDAQIKLRNEIENQKYDPSNQDRPISITKDNVCVNGHHRLTSLLEYYGEDYEVTLRKLNFSYRHVLWLTIKTIFLHPKFFFNR